MITLDSFSEDYFGGFLDKCTSSYLADRMRGSSYVKIHVVSLSLQKASLLCLMTRVISFQLSFEPSLDILDGYLIVCATVHNPASSAS